MGSQVKGVGWPGGLGGGGAQGGGAQGLEPLRGPALPGVAGGGPGRGSAAALEGGHVGTPEGAGAVRVVVPGDAGQVLAATP